MTTILALCLALLLSGCATTLQHPVTQHQVTCQTGVAIHWGSGPIGWAIVGLSALANLAYYSTWQDCVDNAKAAGYDEMPTAPPI